MVAIKIYRMALNLAKKSKQLSQSTSSIMRRPSTPRAFDNSPSDDELEPRRPPRRNHPRGRWTSTRDGDIAADDAEDVIRSPWQGRNRGRGNTRFRGWQPKYNKRSDQEVHIDDIEPSRGRGQGRQRGHGRGERSGGDYERGREGRGSGRKLHSSTETFRREGMLQCLTLIAKGQPIAANLQANLDNVAKVVEYLMTAYLDENRLFDLLVEIFTDDSVVQDQTERKADNFDVLFVRGTFGLAGYLMLQMTSDEVPENASKFVCAVIQSAPGYLDVSGPARQARTNNGKNCKTTIGGNECCA